MKKKKLPEDEARFLFQQLCIGLNYLHCENIVHRDLKVCARSALPCLCGAVVAMALIQSLWSARDVGDSQPDNLLLCAERGVLRLKIADFGFAKFSKPTEFLISDVGTLAYRGTHLGGRARAPG